MRPFKHLTLPVPAAYAFDYLAILYVKQRAGLPVDSEIDTVERALDRQLSNFHRIVVSREFLALRDANERVFRAVARSRGTAAQRTNRRRHRAKVALQSAFWPSTPYAEAKTPSER